MTAVAMNPLEAVLRLIAQAEPDSWYPRAYAERSGTPLESLHYFLEHLYLDGLIEKGETSPKDGPGVVLTAKGKDLLEDPEGLERLRQGQALDPNDRGGIVREALRQKHPPVVTRFLLLANFLVFGYGIYLAWPGKVQAFLGTFLRMGPGVGPILTKSGVLHLDDLVKGQWWRLFTTTFVHFGPLHLLMNMYALWVVGKNVERMWGWSRYLVLYLLSGLGGTCLSAAIRIARATTFQEFEIPMGGASGAVCGVFAAEAVWILLNRRYLPRDLVRQCMGGFIGTAVLLIFLSLFPGVDGWAHLGGALTGAIIGVLLNWQRFGPDPWRWLGILALLPLPWIGSAMLQRACNTNAIWFEKTYLPRIRKAMTEASTAYQTHVQPVVRKHWERRDAEEVEKALGALTGPLGTLTHLAKDLSRTGPYRSELAESARQKALEYVRGWIRQLELAERCLREKDRFSRKDDHALEQENKAVERLREEWNDLLTKPGDR